MSAIVPANLLTLLEELDAKPIDAEFLITVSADMSPINNPFVPVSFIVPANFLISYLF